jgi:ubiquinol-cytochrome c reductase iron-sulfur subunit
VPSIQILCRTRCLYAPGRAPINRFEPGDAELGAGPWILLPCHGSKFDLSAASRGVPAPTNLEVPPYTFADTGRIVIGVDQERIA